MGKKILFAVMALLVMATGKIWAQDTAEKKAYAVLCQNGTDDQGVTTYTMYFLYTSEAVTTGDTGGKIDFRFQGMDGPNSKEITYTKAWEVALNAANPAWNSATEKAPITEVVFEDSFKDVKVMSCWNWFYSFTSLAEIKGIEYLDTSEVTTMIGMFFNCSSLTELNLSSFDTSKVTNMTNMFKGCSGLTTLILSSFNTSSVTSMVNMFDGCSSLTSLDLSSFNTSKVPDMSSMFYGCSSLTSLDLSSFNTSEVTDMNNMFGGCGSLTSLDLSSFNTSKVTNMMSMFYGCKALTSLTLGSFDMSKVTNFVFMFDECITSNITIKGNALVFLESDDQKEIWKNITGVRLMVKKDGEDKYVSDGTIDITLDNDEDTPVIFPDIFTANSVTFTRKFTAGNPHTVCLPFAITNTTDYGTFYKLSGYDKDNRRVKFTKVDATKANKPYLFIPDKNKADVTKIEVKGDVDIYSTIYGEYGEYVDDNTCFICVYDKLTFTAEFLAENNGYDFYGWTADGSFKRATAGASVAPCRAYIKLAKGGAGIGSAPARLSVEFDDGETTGIDTIGTAKSGANGGADAPMYNLQGQRVSGGYKGVVIKNGKKMIVR